MLKGIFPAITTPFNADGTLDLLALKNNFSLWNSSALAGYLVLGSTGEVVHMEDKEKLAVLEMARENIPPAMSMVVGTGLHSTQETIAFTKRAATSGADYALVVTPHYFKSAMTAAVLQTYYQQVADASPIPILLYSVPQFTGITLQPETIAKLAEHPNIHGIKDSSGDMRALIYTLTLVKSDFALLTGSAPIVYPALNVGASGAILAVANFAPQTCQQIFQSVGNAQLLPARRAQEKLLLISERIASRYGIGGIKSAMDILGYQGGYVRSPLIMPDKQAKETIYQVLKESELFPTLQPLEK